MGKARTTNRGLCARVRLDDRAPAWLKRGTGASISCYPTFESELFGWPIIREGLLKEVTLCSATHKPVEPLAKVILLRDEEPSGVGEVIVHERGAVLRRNCGQILGVR